MIDVLLSLSIIATLAVTSSQIQIKQQRLQDVLTQRLQASALLDTWAERRQMSVSAGTYPLPVMSGVSAVVGAASGSAGAGARAAAEGAAAGAALRLPKGRAYEHQRGEGFMELEIRWRGSSLSRQHGEGYFARRSGDASGGTESDDEHLSESILVASMP